MARPAGVTAVTLPGDLEFSTGGVRTDHLIGAFVKRIDGNGVVTVQDDQGREFTYSTSLQSAPIAVFIGTGQPTDERFGAPIDRPLIAGAGGSAINQRYPFEAMPQQTEFGGENLGIEFLSSGDVPADADLYGDETVVPDGCVVRVPPGLWDMEIGMHLQRFYDAQHATHLMKVMAGVDDRDVTEGGSYSGSGQSVFFNASAIRSNDDYFYLAGDGVNSNSNGASYYWLFRYLGV